MQATGYSKAMIEKAERLAELVPTFPRGRSKDGIEFVVVPGSEPNVGHRTNGLGCTCRGYDRRGYCTHALAVRTYQTRESMQRIEAAQQLRAQNGRCKQVGCIMTALVQNGRCAAHNAAICDRLGI